MSAGKIELPVMLAHKYMPKHARFPAVIEPKIDGVRAIVVVDPKAGRAQAYSRLGNPFTSVRNIERALLEAARAHGWNSARAFDGELTCGSFRETVSRIKHKDAEAKGAVFTMFDLLPWPLVENFGVSLRWRRDLLENFCNTQAPANCPLVQQWAIRHDDDVQRFYLELRERGYEGAIVKDPESRWTGKRSRAYLKLKAKETLDLTIVGAARGEGRLSDTLGYLVCSLDAAAKGVARLRNTVRVGSGIHDSDRAELWQLHQQGKLVGRVVEVSFHEYTPDGSLRHPVFKGLRIDK